MAPDQEGQEERIQVSGSQSFTLPFAVRNGYHVNLLTRIALLIRVINRLYDITC
jgi:hypothetical protein